ncbi:pyruvate, phosphate dikinase [Nocardia vinacea]|uniref:pyruvate, phosphate dikinase n=1 Tax=Nocardia vinacea TaxID=96468 RepID=UPI003418BB20
MTAIVNLDVVLLNGTSGLDKATLGGKAWSIERMRALGMPVPPAFVLSSEVCKQYYDNDRQLPENVTAALPAAIAELENATDRQFGRGERPLLLSVRSGAAISMPGMMDTILNLGLNNDIEQFLAEHTGDVEFARDTRRRFVQQFENIVGTTPPDDPWQQLLHAIDAVFESWTGRRAVEYRRARGISDALGTAVTVQAMVFGNLDDRSGTGVLFTRNPLTGDPAPYGEWLVRGQGEDVVSGRLDARPIEQLGVDLPDVHYDLIAKAAVLERDRCDVQDIEYTVESGRLWLLQSRGAKRSPEATVRHAVQLQREGLISVDDALDRIQPEHIEFLVTQHVDLAVADSAAVVAEGKPACPGIAVGVVVTDVEEAERRAEAGEDVVLARPTTDPDDVATMAVAVAVLTEFGGSTSHAAVVCRELSVPCVVGCGDRTVTELAGQTVTVDATTGVVYPGALPVTAASERDDPDLSQLLLWTHADDSADGNPSLAERLRRRASLRLDPTSK